MIGIDIVSIKRIERLIDKYGELFLRRFLSEDEIALCKSDRINIKRVAGFFAAKEALSKALGTGIGAKLGFHDIVISKNATHAPKITLLPHAMDALKIRATHVSITHDGGFAAAAVIVEYR